MSRVPPAGVEGALGFKAQGARRMTPEEIEKRRAEYRASWEAGLRALADPEFMAKLRAKLAEIRAARGMP